MKRKVLFYTNIPSPYRVDFFNELGKHCDLTVLFEKAESTERDASWKEQNFKSFTGIVLKGVSIKPDLAFCPGISKYLVRGKYDAVFVCVLASPTAILAVNALKRRHIPYYYEGDGGFAGSARGVKAVLKRYVIAGAEKCFSTSAEFDRYCMAYGAKQENIIRYPLSSYFESEIKQVSPEEKKALKAKHGITEEIAIVSCGQMIHRKGFDLLLEAAKKLPENVGIYIVGGRPTEEYLQLQRDNAHPERVHFLDFMDRPRLMEFFSACDIFALFTREDIWGLVTGEAMAAGLPVISTDRCLAAVEMISDGGNGYIVASDYATEMEAVLTEMVRNADLTAFGEKAQNTAREYTIEKMVEKHLRVIEQ